MDEEIKRELESLIQEVNAALDCNLDQRITELEQVLGYVMNILHFIVTDRKLTYTSGTRESVWKILDEAIALQNGRKK